MPYKDPEKRREKDRKWRATNAEKHREDVRAWKSANPEKNKAAERRKYLRRQYGITVDQYDIMFDMNGGNCWFCDLPRKEGGRRLAVEHCHKTGRVRGLVHWICNSYYIGKHDLESARRLVQYLENNFDGRDL